MWIQQSVTARRGDIYLANLAPVVGSEQGGIRPVLVIQNDVGNWHSPTIIVAIITSQIKNQYLPTHVLLNLTCGLPRESMAMLEQIRTIDKKRIYKYVGQVDRDQMRAVDAALKVSMGLTG